MSKEEYVKDCWKRGESYINSVTDGTLVTNKWIKLAVKEYKLDLKRTDIYFNKDKVDKIFKFFYYLNINPNERFMMFDYQIFLLLALFGFYREDTDTRMVQSVFLFIAKKNGKTTFAAALQLYFLIADGEFSPQSILVASNKTQAMIAVGAASDIVHNSPDLRKRLISTGHSDSRQKITFRDKSKPGYLKAFAPYENRVEGLKPSCGILDEIHLYPDWKLYNAVKSGTIGRKNPMMFAITTAGFIDKSICQELVDIGKNQLESKIERDDSYFYLLYTLDDDDDYNNEANWIKANPGIEEILPMRADLRVKQLQSKQSPLQKANYLTKHLNIFTEEPSDWMAKPVLEKASHKLDINDFKGSDVYMAGDFAKVKDFASITLLFHPTDASGIRLNQDPSAYIIQDNNFYSFTYLFYNKEKQEKTWDGGYSLPQWVEQNYVIQSKKASIDYDEIFDYFKIWDKDFNIIEVKYDPYNKRDIIPNLEDYGIKCTGFPQWHTHYNNPIKTMQQKIIDEQFTFDYNPCVLWQFNNIVLETGRNENQKFVKDKNANPIDAGISNAMAMGAYLDNKVSEGVDFAKIYANI